MTTDLLKPEYRTIKGKRMVLLPQTDFEELLRKSDLWEPPLPDADADGNRPAEAYAAISLARHILRERRKFGLSQTELALLLGASRPKVNAALAVLESAGAVQRSGQDIVCEREMLGRLAEA